MRGDPGAQYPRSGTTVREDEIYHPRHAGLSQILQSRKRSIDAVSEMHHRHRPSRKQAPARQQEYKRQAHRH